MINSADRFLELNKRYYKLAEAMNYSELLLASEYFEMLMCKLCCWGLAAYQTTEASDEKM